MAQAKLGNTVKVHYSVKLDDGTVVDSTLGNEPFTFTIGVGQVIIGFDDAVLDMSPGTSKTVKVPWENAYGAYNKALTNELDRSEFPADFQFEIGQYLQIPQIEGQPLLLKVLKVTESSVTVDENHPLAGKDLTIDIQLLEIL